MNTWIAKVATVSVLLLLIGTVSAKADEYTMASVNKDAAFIVNEATRAQVRQGVERAWLLVVSSPSHTSETPAWRQELVEFECAGTARFRFLSVVNYDAAGDVLGGGSDAPSGWVYAPPHSNIDNTRAYVCGGAIFPAVKLGNLSTPDKAAAYMIDLYKKLPSSY
jgi:hypothetical protein